MKRLSVLIVVLAVLATSCTSKMQARTWGGTDTVQLPAGKKLVNASWKNADLWYLVRPMRADEQPETFEYIESSAMGVYEGRVVLQERR